MIDTAPPPPSEDWRPSLDPEAVDDPLTDCLMHLGKLYNLPVPGQALRAGLPFGGQPAHGRTLRGRPIGPDLLGDS